MADLSITAANVKRASKASQTLEVQFGETVTEGQALYKKLTTSQYLKAHCETSEATAKVAGIAITPGVVDGYGFILTDGPIYIGATMVQGKAYFLSTAGLLMPVDDIAANDWVSFIGIAESTDILDVSLKNFGWQKT